MSSFEEVRSVQHPLGIKTFFYEDLEIAIGNAGVIQMRQVLNNTAIAVLGHWIHSNNGVAATVGGTNTVLAAGPTSFVSLTTVQPMTTPNGSVTLFLRIGPKSRLFQITCVLRDWNATPIAYAAGDLYVSTV